MELNKWRLSSYISPSLTSKNCLALDRVEITKGPDRLWLVWKSRVKELLYVEDWLLLKARFQPVGEPAFH